MLNLVQDQNDKLLGPVYSWMVGNIDSEMRRTDVQLRTIGLRGKAAGIAIGLGAGFGMHPLLLDAAMK